MLQSLLINISDYKTPPSLFFIAMLSAGLALLLISLLSQVYRLSACPLCLIQQSLLWAFFLSAIIGYLLSDKKVAARLCSGLNIVWSLLGMLISARQIWLQSLGPDLAPPCTPSLFYLLQHSSLFNTVQTVLMQSGDCARVDMQILGWSLAQWACLLFSTFFCLSVYTAYRACVQQR